LVFITGLIIIVIIIITTTRHDADGRGGGKGSGMGRVAVEEKVMNKIPKEIKFFFDFSGFLFSCDR